MKSHYHQARWRFVCRAPSRAWRDRRGFSMTELIVSSVLLTTIFAVALPTLRWIGLEQRAAGQRQLATIEAANLMDRIASRPWNELNPEFAKSVKVSDDVQRQLLDADVNVAITTPADDANAKQIALTLKWQDRKNVPVAPVRLTTWVYRRGRSQ